MEHMSKKPFEGEATVWWNLSSHVNCGWRPAAYWLLTPQQYRWSLQVLKVDCASCELGVVRAIVVLCNHRRLLWRKASRLSSLKADGVTNLWLLQRTNNRFHNRKSKHKCSRMSLTTEKITPTCKMLTGRSTVSWEWELEGWELNWKARSPSLAGSSCVFTHWLDTPTTAVH